MDYLRTIFALAVVSILLQGLARSQGVRLGIEFGGAATWIAHINPDSVKSSKGKPFVSVTGFIEKTLNDNFSLRTGLRFGSIGNEGNYSHVEWGGGEGPFGSYGTFETRQDYLSIPMRLKYSFGIGLPYSLIGAEFGYLVNATLKRDIDVIYSPGDGTHTYHLNEKSDVTEDVDRLNIAVSFGIGYELSILDRFLSLQITYAHGISEIENKTNFLESQFIGKTRELGLSLGYFF